MELGEENEKRVSRLPETPCRRANRGYTGNSKIATASSAQRRGGDSKLEALRLQRRAV